MKYFFGVIGVVLAVLLTGWALGWILVPGQVTSVENVQKQWAFAYQYHESLKAAAQQVCTAEKAVKDSASPDESTQRRTQEMTYEQNYFRIQAEYNTELRNAFEAKHVAPSDVPRIAPTLQQMKQEVCQ